MDAPAPGTRTGNRWLIGLGVAVALVALLALVVTLAGDDEGVETVDTTSTTAADTTTSASTTSTTSGSEVDAAQAVFPDPATSRRFDSPDALAHAFVTELVGMTNPVVGTFAQGDARSGEIEVRGFDDGPVTTLLVRQLEDDSWFVIGALTDSIQPAVPEQGATITSPQPLAGMAYAFEGTVGVRLYADGTAEPIATTFVTGRGDGVLGDYAGEVTFEVPTGATHGVLLYTSEGGEDGAPIAFTATRVAFT